MDQTAVHENGKKLLFLIISDGCAVRVLDGGDRDRSLEDADTAVVPGLFSFSEGPVHGTGWGGEDGPDVFAGAVLCWGGSGAVRKGVCRDWSGVGSAGEMRIAFHKFSINQI